MYLYITVHWTQRGRLIFEKSVTKRLWPNQKHHPWFYMDGEKLWNCRARRTVSEYRFEQTTSRTQHRNLTSFTAL